MKQNSFLAKSKQMNSIGLIGCGLALIGMLLPVVSFKIDLKGIDFPVSIGIGHFTLTSLVVIPLLLIIGAVVLYVMKLDKPAMIIVLVSIAVYLLIFFVGRYSSNTNTFWGKTETVSLDDLLEDAGELVKIRIGVGFYLSVIGHLVAIMGIIINFNHKTNVVDATNMPYIHQGTAQTPYVAQPQGSSMNQAGQNEQQQVTAFTRQKTNPYVQQASIAFNQAMNNPQPFSQQVNPYVQQTNPYEQQVPLQGNSSLNPMYNQAGQAQNQANPYLNQEQGQASQAQGSARYSE